MAPHKEDRMNHIKDILVVYDSKTDNRTLIEKAVRLGQRNQARVNVVNVVEEAPRKMVKPIRPEPVDSQGPGIDIIEEFPRDTSMPVRLGPPADAHQHKTETAEKLSLDIQEHMIQARKPNLDEFVTGIRQAGVQVSSKTLYGTPFLEIIREVLRNRHDLAMITAEGGSSLKQMLFGSTTMHLMRKCPCPVWVIRPGQAKQHGPILAAVNPTPEDIEPKALNSRIMDLAILLGRLEQSQLIIIHTWRMHGESVLRSRRSMLHEEEVDELVRETRGVHRQALTELLRRHPLEELNYQVYMIKGEAGTLIPELARKKEVELIIMGTLSRSGIAGLLIGNTAEKVLQQVDCSVLTVKPEGFVSPISQEPA